MSTMNVRYFVEYECELEVSPEDNIDDRLSDIDIPEGGNNNSKYVANTFKVLWAVGEEKWTIENIFKQM